MVFLDVDCREVWRLMVCLFRLLVAEQDPFLSRVDSLLTRLRGILL